jgi:hypothetical protein
MRTWLADRVDAIACRVGVWALTHIWGRCRPPYADGCMGCRVGSMCDEMEAIMHGRLGVKP